MVGRNYKIERDGDMTNQEIRGKILSLMYSECQALGMGVMVPIEEMARALGLEQKDVLRETQYLVQKGLLKRMAIGHVTITIDGVDEVEQTDTNVGSELPLQQNQVFNIGSLSGGAVNVGGSQTIILNANQLLEQFNKGLEEVEMEDDERKTILEKLKDLSQHPAFIAVLNNILAAGLSL